MPTKVTYKQLAQRKLTTTGIAILYTVPDSNTKTYIHTIIATNLDSSARSYSLFLNPGGSTAVADDQNTLFDTELLAGNTHDLHTFPGDTALTLSRSGASILAQATTANTIVISIFGKEVVET